jgi:hypothetical protein
MVCGHKFLVNGFIPVVYLIIIALVNNKEGGRLNIKDMLLMS